MNATTQSSPTVQAKFFALGEPVRLAIVTKLAEGPKTAGELAEPFAISRPAVSRHLRVLREAGLARAEVRGREWWYTLEPQNLDAINAYIEEIQAMWQSALHAFKHYVEEDLSND